MECDILMTPVQGESERLNVNYERGIAVTTTGRAIAVVRLLWQSRRRCFAWFVPALKKRTEEDLGSVSLSGFGKEARNLEYGIGNKYFEYQQSYRELW